MMLWLGQRSLHIQKPSAFLFINALGLPTNEAVAHHMIQKQLDRYAENRYGLQKLIHRETGFHWVLWAFAPGG